MVVVLAALRRTCGMIEHMSGQSRRVHAGSSCLDWQDIFPDSCNILGDV